MKHELERLVDEYGVVETLAAIEGWPTSMTTMGLPIGNRGMTIRDGGKEA